MTESKDGDDAALNEVEAKQVLAMELKSFVPNAKIEQPIIVSRSSESDRVRLTVAISKVGQDAAERFQEHMLKEATITQHEHDGCVLQVVSGVYRENVDCCITVYQTTNAVETIFRTFQGSSREAAFDGTTLTLQERVRVCMAEVQIDECPTIQIVDGQAVPEFYPVRDGKLKGFGLTDLAGMEAIFIEPNYGR